MRRLLFPLLLLIALDAAAFDLPRANEKWFTLKVDEFEIISNAPPAATIEMAENLMRMRAAIGQLTQFRVRSRLPVKVYLFANERMFAPYRDIVFRANATNITGVFVGGENENVILLQTGSPNGVDRIIYHELTHYFVQNTVSGLPSWLNEGLAEYYSTFQTSGDQVHIGRPIADHVLWLRDEQLIPFKDLFAVDHDSPIYNETSKRGAFYAESWALLHYLMVGNEERHAQFSTFLSLLIAHKPQEEAFEAAFGVNYAKMENELRSYLRRSLFHYMKYSLNELPVSPIPKPEPMTYAEYVYALGHLIAQGSAENTPLALQFLNDALKANPANAAAYADIGKIHDEAGRTSDAEAAYQRAVQLGSNDPETYVLYGTSLLNRQSARNSKGQSEELLKARKLFERATQLDPQSARAWSGLGATYLTEDDPTIGIATLEKSLTLAPGDPQSAFYLVQLYARAGRGDEAKKLIDTVLVPNGNRDTIARARESLLVIDIQRVETLTNSGKVKEGLALAKATLEKATDPFYVMQLREMIDTIESWDADETARATLNDAVMMANAGKYAEALAVVDQLLPTITDAQTLQKTKEFRDQVAERAKRKKK
jgi:tetratricopeptide (TPR) repeat protein